MKRTRQAATRRGNCRACGRPAAWVHRAGYAGFLLADSLAPDAPLHACALWKDGRPANRHAVPTIEDPDPVEPSDDAAEEAQAGPYYEEPTPDERTPQRAATDATSLLQQAIEAIQAAGKAQAGVDAGAVAAIVAAEVDKLREELQSLAPRRVETVLRVERIDAPAVTIETAHPLFARLFELVKARIHVYLHGDPGAGKSHAARQVSDALFGAGRFGYISLAPQTSESRLFGFIDATGVYRATEFFVRYTTGGVFCADEMDNASDNLLTTLNSALENGHAAFPHGQFERHPDFVFVATGNTCGRGGTANHAGRRPFDAATAERFVYLAWGYDEVLEDKLAFAQLETAGAWVAFVRAVRAFAKANYPRLVVSPRASVRGAQLIKAGVFGTGPQAIREIADAVLFKGFDPDSVARILSTCTLPSIETR